MQLGQKLQRIHSIHNNRKDTDTLYRLDQDGRVAEYFVRPHPHRISPSGMGQSSTK